VPCKRLIESFEGRVHVLPAVKEDFDKTSEENNDKQTTEYNTRSISAGGEYDRPSSLHVLVCQLQAAEPVGGFRLRIRHVGRSCGK
jgi:hypothetical protein